MPQIEVIPNTSTKAAPGWTYVADTGAKNPVQPTGPRNRNARNVLASGSEANTTRQNTAITRHLAELDRENHRDVQIPVPVRHRDGANRASRGKVTQSVRRILESQKTFAHHLSDEAALLDQAASAPAPVKTPLKTPVRGSRTALPVSRRGGRGRGVATPTPLRTATSAADLTALEVGGESGKWNDKAEPGVGERAKEDAEMGDAPTVAAEVPPQKVVYPEDEDPLLVSRLHEAPAPDVVERLLAAPPLSYTAARAQLKGDEGRGRSFCEICGYWGRARCMKCGARVCGIECRDAHDQTRCLKFYA